MSRWILVLTFALVCHGNGAALLESFVNYPSWHLIGAGEFAGYHRFIVPRVVAWLVLPVALGTVGTLLMLRWRPSGIPARAVQAALALQVVTWVATLTTQLPIQRRLSAAGLSHALIDHLIVTNLWFRRLPMALVVVLFVWMLERSLSARAR